jgi:hypothetical protein
MPRNPAKSHAFEYGFQQALFRRGKFDEFEPIKTQRVIKHVGHHRAPVKLVTFATKLDNRVAQVNAAMA